MFKIYQVRLLAVFAICILSSLQLLAQQLPQINYQGVARNADGSPVASQSISLRLTIRDGGANGTSVYSETRQRTTNKFGLFTAVIGSTGTVAQNGSMATINWSTGNKFLQVELDPNGGNSFTDMGTSQLQSVPYAIFASSAGSGVKGDTGATGATGSTGATGAQGLQGIQGERGLPGAMGLTGAVGAQGPQGLPGERGLPGAMGLTGAVGAQGLQGERGLPGAMGLTGAAGLTGLTGLTGAVGLQGPQGIQGETGSAGPAGAAGLPGAPGAVGPAGPQGIPGIQGPQGVSNLTSVGAISAASTAAGASLTSGVLNLAPANASNGGVITVGAQTIPGNKTFSNAATFQSSVTAAAIVKSGGTSSQFLMADGSVSTAGAPALSTTYEAYGITLSATYNGAIFYSQHSSMPTFPANLPDGFKCVIVNYSNSTFLSNTLTTARFFKRSSGNTGVTSFQMATGGTVFVHVVTIDGLKRYYLSGDVL